VANTTHSMRRYVATTCGAALVHAESLGTVRPLVRVA